MRDRIDAGYGLGIDHVPPQSGNPPQSGQLIPLPRRPSDGISAGEETAPIAHSRYDRSGPVGRDWAFSGQVEYVGGSEGDQMRAAVADAVRQLLEWAVDKQHRESEEREAA
jgi:hypothetical protein